MIEIENIDINEGEIKNKKITQLLENGNEQIIEVYSSDYIAC